MLTFIWSLLTLEELVSSSADTFNHLTGAAAVLAFPSVAAPAAAAYRADIFAGAGCSWNCLIARVD
jgi:hypothetical protein